MIAVVYDQLFTVENIDIEIGFPYLRKKEITIPLSSARTMRIRELPAIETAVTTVWLGGVDRYLSYGALGLWMEAKDYRFAGAPREVMLEPMAPERIQEAVVEIQFPVEKIG
jgi:effector-binding domain-containing protein